LIVQADIAAAINATIGGEKAIGDWCVVLSTCQAQDAEMTTVRLGWSGEII